MAKTILLIEADDAFAASLTDVLESRGAAVQRTGNGKEGLKLAEAGGLDAIILCVELPKMSGYAVCNKLKKSDELKQIPLVIMSSEATPKTFDQHKKLKTRAEEYVIKPCDPAEVAEKIDALVGLEPAGGESLEGDDDDLELLEDAFDSLEMTDDDGETLEAGDDDIEEIALDALEVTEDQVEEVDSADLAIDALGDDEVEMVTETGESADDAIESLGGDSAADAIESLGEDDAIESLGEDDDALEALGGDDAEDALEALGEDTADDAVESLGGADEAAPAAGGATARRLAKLEEENAALRKTRTELESRLTGIEDDLRAKTNELEAFRSGGGGGAKEALKLKSELTQKNKEVLSLKEALNEKEKAELAWQERETELELKAADLEEKALQSEAQAKTLGEKVGAQNERLEKLQAELDEAYEAGRKAGELEAELESVSQERDQLRGEMDEVRGRAEAAESKVKGLEDKARALEEHIANTNAELEKLRAEAKDLQEKVDALLPLEEQVQSLESEIARNEERVLKAYQKLKGDEKLREKTRKALSVALDLLDEAPGLVDGSEDEIGEIEDLGDELQAESA